MEKINLKRIAEMSDKEILEITVLNPSGNRAFMFEAAQFENDGQMYECLEILKNRLDKIGSNLV